MLPLIRHLAIWEACISVISEIRKNNRTCNYGCSHDVICHRMQQGDNRFINFRFTDNRNHQ